MKLDAYAEIYLWNKSVEALNRVLQRLRGLRLLSSEVTTHHEVWLEEIRASLNAEFCEAMVVRESADHLRLHECRTAAEQTNQSKTAQ